MSASSQATEFSLSCLRFGNSTSIIAAQISRGHAGLSTPDVSFPERALHRQAITTKLGVHGVAELTTLTRATRYHRRAVVKDVAVTITCSTENRVVENRP